MTTREWALVGAVVGLGIVAQIPGHGESEGEHDHGAMDHEAMAAMQAAAAPGSATVSLHVTGMT